VRRPTTFDKKIVRFITRTLLAVTLLVFLISTVSAVLSLSAKSARMARQEADVLKSNTIERFRQYREMMWAVNLDAQVQKYLLGADNSAEAFAVLSNVSNIRTDVNFLSLIRLTDSDSVTKGSQIPFWMPDFTGFLLSDYETGVPMNDGQMRLVFSRDYSVSGAWTLTIFYPMYLTSRVGYRLGMLCINLADAGFLQMLQDDPNTGFAYDTYFVDSRGTVIVSADTEKIGQALPGFDAVSPAGETRTLQYISICEKLDGWNFYYVSRIGWWSILRDSVITLLLTVALVAVLFALMLREAKRLVGKAYAPWGNVVTAMGRVSAGDLTTRLLPEDTDTDMAVVAEGFNEMTSRLTRQMQQIQEEQQRITQVRLEQLHSQIQPHFLYNTLDAIHWQAVSDRNPQISSLIKALASYYRTVLSKGRDVIPLADEMNCVRNYLYIQQTRFSSELSFQIDMQEELAAAAIPKLTLQPLVENAVYHGFEPDENRTGMITITAEKLGDCVLILVGDNGIGMTDERIAEINRLVAEDDETFGYGIRNVNRRIQLLFGSRYGLHYDRSSTGGVTVTVRFPFVAEREMTGRPTLTAAAR